MPKNDPVVTKVLDLIREEVWAEVARVFSELHPADIADVINHAPVSSHPRLFSLVSQDAKPDVLSELTDRAETDVLEAMEDRDISGILGHMAPDDAADVLVPLSDERSRRILGLMPHPEATEVRSLMKYDADTAGGIMTPDVVAMKKEQTVDEALQAIAYLDSDEPFFYANVVDKNGRLIGYVGIWQLVRERDRARRLDELAHTDFIAAQSDMDQEEVSRLMAKYNLPVIPVVDPQGKLVGRITADDVMDVIEEEATEDILRFAGSNHSEMEHPSVLKTCLVRLPWLFVTLFGGFLVTIILKHFHSYISGGDSIGRQTLALAAFVPSVLAMGGNTAIQSSAIVIRSIALGDMAGRSVIRLLLREIVVGAMMGCLCGIIIGVWASVITSASGQPGAAFELSPYQLASIVGIALLCSMAFAALFGAGVPIALDKLHIDPAVASGPFVTIANDISALLIYFAATALLVNAFAAT